MKTSTPISPPSGPAQWLFQGPSAERLLRNLLNYAARDLDKPPTDLPADFQQQLKAIGYE